MCLVTGVGDLRGVKYGDFYRQITISIFSWPLHTKMAAILFFLLRSSDAYTDLIIAIDVDVLGRRKRYHLKANNEDNQFMIHFIQYLFHKIT